MKQFVGESNGSASASRNYRCWTSCSCGRQDRPVYFSGSSSVGMVDTVISSSASVMDRRCGWSECAHHFKEGM